MSVVGWWPIALAGSCLVSVAVALVRRALSEPDRLALRRVDLCVSGLPEGLEGYTVLHVSDMHVSRRGQREESLVELCQVDADLIVFTGDYVAREASAAAVCVDVVHDMLRGRVALGVLGNNDYNPEIPMDAMIAGFEAAGLRMLRNRSVTVRWGGCTLVVGGVEDPVWHLDDVGRAFAGSEQGAFKILLAHSPHPFDGPDLAGVSAMLVGHTHGGQVCLPIVGSLYPPSRHITRYISGPFRRGSTVMYVSKGVGTNRLPIRLFCPPEVILYTLRDSSGTDSR